MDKHGFLKNNSSYLLPLLPFQHSINVNKDTLEYYIDRLNKKGLNGLPTYNELIEFIQDLINRGWLKESNEFEDLLEISPSLVLFFRKTLNQLAPPQRNKLLHGFINFLADIATDLNTLLEDSEDSEDKPLSQQALNLAYCATQEFNFLFAINWSLEQQEPLMAFKNTLDEYYTYKSFHQEGLQLFEECIQKLENYKEENKKSPFFLLSLTSCYGSLADIYAELKEKEKAHEANQKVLTLYKKFPKEYKNEIDLEDLYINLGISASALNKREDSLHYYEQALLLVKEQDKRTKATILFNLGNYWMDEQAYNRARTSFEDALKNVKENEQMEAAIYQSMGLLENEVANYQLAISYHEKALMYYKKRNDIEQQAKVLQNLVLALNNTGAYDVSLKKLHQATKIFIQLGDENNLGRMYQNLGNTYYETEIFDDAEIYFNRALTIFQNQEDTYASAEIWQNLGILYGDIKQFTKAVEANERALALYTQDTLQDFAKINIAEVHQNLGVLYSENDFFDKAKKYYGKALVYYQEVKDFPLLEGEVYLNLGNLNSLQNEVKQAFFYYDKAKTIIDEFSEAYLFKSSLNQNIGNLHFDLEAYSKALFYYEEALRMSQKIRDKRKEADNCQNIGNAFFYLKKPKKALIFYVKALNIYKTLEDTFGLAENYLGAANAYQETQKYTEAKEYYAKSIELFEILGEEKYVEEIKIELKKVSK